MGVSHLYHTTNMMIEHNERTYKYQNRLNFFPFAYFLVYIWRVLDKKYIQQQHIHEISASLSSCIYIIRVAKAMTQLQVITKERVLCHMYSIAGMTLFTKMNLMRCPTLSHLLAFNGLSTQEGIICFLGSKSLFYLYHYDEGAFNLYIEKTLVKRGQERQYQAKINTCTLNPKTDCQFGCFVADY